MMNDCISRPSLLDDDQYIRKADQPLFCVASSYKAWCGVLLVCIMWQHRFLLFSFSFFWLLFEPLFGLLLLLAGGSFQYDHEWLGRRERRGLRRAVFPQGRGWCTHVWTEVALYVKRASQGGAPSSCRSAHCVCWPDVNISNHQRAIIFSLGRPQDLYRTSQTHTKIYWPSTNGDFLI